MFLHLGGDFSVGLTDVVSIHPWDMMESSATNKKFLEEKDIRDLSGGKPKSIVITRDAIYLSKLSSETLRDRII